MWAYPPATLAPAVVLGAIGEVPTYLIDDRRVMDLTISLVTAHLAYYRRLASCDDGTAYATSVVFPMGTPV